jgi:hypothetical protein
MIVGVVGFPGADVSGSSLDFGVCDALDMTRSFPALQLLQRAFAASSCSPLDKSTDETHAKQPIPALCLGGVGTIQPDGAS